MSSDTYTVVSTMKNEGPYILEWVAHYRALGFDKFVVCTNDCTDTTVEMLKRLEEMGLVRHHATAIRNGGIHRSALRQARRYAEVQEARWVFVCDVDEFLNIHMGDGSVRALVEGSGDGFDVICVPWRIFGSAGVEEIADAPVTRQFTLAELPHDPVARPGTGKFVKSLFTNQEKFGRMGLHAPVMPKDRRGEEIAVLPGGARYHVGGTRTENPPAFDLAQVNHYALRSMDSFLVKRARGRANHSHHVLGLDYWERFDLNEAPDASIARYDAAARAVREELHADPVLADLHARAVEWHRRKAAAMRMDPELDGLVAALKGHVRRAAA